DRQWSSRRSATNRDLAHQHRRLARGDRHALALLAAHASPRFEVVPYCIDHTQHFGAVADELRSANRARDLALLDAVGLGDAEAKVAGRGVDLSAAELDAVDAVFDAANDVVGFRLAGEQERIRHAWQRQMAIRFAATVPTRHTPFFARAQHVVHVVGE